MSLHIVHFIGPINHNSACAVRNCCLQALQNGATEIELHLSTEGGNMTAGFALYFFLKSLPLPLTTHNIGSVESVGVVIFLAGQKRYATIFLDATREAGHATDIRANLTGKARIFTAEEAVQAGIVHDAIQARLPGQGTTCHWWN